MCTRTRCIGLTGESPVYEFIKRLSACDADFLGNPPELQALKLQVFQNIGDMNDEKPTDLFTEISNYYYGQARKEIIICKFVRGKHGGHLFHQQLLSNQVGLLVYPEHEAFFAGIHRKYSREKGSPESLFDDEEKVSNKCCCFFNSTKNKTNLVCLFVTAQSSGGRSRRLSLSSLSLVY